MMGNDLEGLRKEEVDNQAFSDWLLDWLESDLFIGIEWNFVKSLKYL